MSCKNFLIWDHLWNDWQLASVSDICEWLPKVMHISFSLLAFGFSIFKKQGRLMRGEKIVCSQGMIHQILEYEPGILLILIAMSSWISPQTSFMEWNNASVEILWNVWISHEPLKAFDLFKMLVIGDFCYFSWLFWNYHLIFHLRSKLQSYPLLDYGLI